MLTIAKVREKYLKFMESLGGSGLLANKEDEEARRKFRKTFNERFKKD